MILVQKEPTDKALQMCLITDQIRNVFLSQQLKSHICSLFSLTSSQIIRFSQSMSGGNDCSSFTTVSIVAETKHKDLSACPPNHQETGEEISA